MSGVGRSSFFSSPLHLFFIDKIYTQFFSNLLIFVVKINLFLLRFFCNFTPILSFFFLRIFFLSAGFFSYIHAMKAFFFISMFVIAWALRDNPRYGAIWRAYKIFFAVLLTILMLDFAKKSLKKWWDK